ncbi:hypothetical protein J2S66_005039 [Saccharothrix longispora]|uniref:Uncharacterized protein n=1 Tax=Saccharothrix longispora TaxID=33920 RepID=A0ABU1Q179_9PSEU|nr:hypothetical protein [Saccharothrix longispora]
MGGVPAERRVTAPSSTGVLPAGSRPAGPRPWVLALAAVAAVLVVGAVAVVGYRVLVVEEDEPMASTGAAVKSGTGELRTDLDPLLARFPVLGAPEGARWMSGTYGRADVPGPSTYWIDAVVTLPADRVTGLVSAHHPVAEGREPSVADGLRDALPPGPFLTGEALTSAFSHDRWRATAYLDVGTGTLVLTATGT